MKKKRSDKRNRKIRCADVQNSRIRILHVVQAAGGVDRFLRTLFKYMDQDRFENILVCSQDFRKSDYRGLVIHVEVLQMTRAIGSNDLKLVRSVRKLIKKYNPDIVFAHSSKAGAVTRLADIGIRNVCIYNPHGWAFNMRTSVVGKLKTYALIERIAAPFCRKIICISEAEKRAALEKKICRENKLQVIYNGVDIDEYENAPHGVIKRTDLQIPKDAFVVGMVGRLSQQKAPDIFIKAAKQIKKVIPNAFFVMVGSGEMEASVRKYAVSNGFSERLIITGWVDNPMDYIELFDIALLLSRWEGFGLVIPEYMLAGKPVIASNTDAIPEIIKDGENGLLVPPDDVNGVKQAVFKLYQDEECRKSFARFGRVCVKQRFDAERMCREYEKLFINETADFRGGSGL